MNNRRVCHTHRKEQHRKSQAEYRRAREGSGKSEDEVMSQFDDVESIGRAIWANEQTVRLQEEGLSRVGYRKDKEEPSFLSEVGKIWKQFALGLMYRLTGITPPTTPLLDSPSGYSSPFGSPTASRP